MGVKSVGGTFLLQEIPVDQNRYDLSDCMHLYFAIPLEIQHFHFALRLSKSLCDYH